MSSKGGVSKWSLCRGPYRSAARDHYGATNLGAFYIISPNNNIHLLKSISEWMVQRPSLTIVQDSRDNSWTQNKEIYYWNVQKIQNKVGLQPKGNELKKGLNTNEVIREPLHSWGKWNTGEQNLSNETRGPKTEHNTHKTRDWQNKTGSNKTWIRLHWGKLSWTHETQGRLIKITGDKTKMPKILIENTLD